MSLMKLLRKFMPGRRSDEETARIMAEYRARRPVEVQKDDECIAAAYENLNATQEIRQRIEQRRHDRTSELPHVPNGSHS